MSPVSAYDRMCAAEARALHDLRAARMSAEKVFDELDQLTDAGVRAEIHDEISTVHQIEVARDASLAVASGGR